MQTDAHLIRDLAAHMCRAHGPSQALLEAGRACIDKLPRVTYIGLAVMARDKQSVRYTTLHSSRPQAPRLGPVATSGAASGIAIDMKQVVNVRDIDAGDLGMDDLQYIKHEHSARSFFATPLIVSQIALGALTLASAEAHAFSGQEEWLQVVAAMCAPYLTLMKSHQELIALEGLVTQMMPGRVALQLRETAAAKAQQQLQQLGPAAAAGRASQEQLEDSSSDDLSDVDLGSTSFTAAAAAAAQQQAAHNGQADVALPLPAARRRQRWQQQQGQQQLPAAPNRHSRQEQQCSWVGVTLTFKQPLLEAAYRTSVCKRWQQWLDGLFLLLSLLSAVGGRLSSGITGNPFIDCMTCLLMLLAVFGLLQQLFAQPTAWYLAWRQPGVAAVQLLRVALFCYELWQLPGHVFVARSGASAAGGIRQLFAWSRAEMAGCGIVLMQGLLGHLSLPLHAALQLAAVLGVVGTLSVVTLHHREEGAVAAVAMHAAGMQLLLGWLVPVAVVALVEWQSRAAFLQKIR